jgi:anaerobic magnesium-protoporphyrin IX monomethyl ester cyclase
MRILILNPPHPSIGSRIPREQLPPLGLLSIGGPLIDAGHDVTLLDGELGPLAHDEVVRRVVAQWLHRAHGVTLFNLADENPTVNPTVWRELCEALIAENLPGITIIGSTRADDIVRDAEWLHLYRKAGIERFLLGIENTDEATLQLVRKGGATKTDRQAIRVMRKHGILSLATWVADFEDVTDRDFWRSLRQLLSYDPDQITALFVTPHRWTGYYRLASHRRVIQLDQRRWDYKHQVLASRHVPPWRVILWVKLIEVLVQARPKAIWRSFFNRDRAARHGMRWYTRMGRRVWFHEWRNFFFRDRRVKDGPTLGEFWGAPQDHEEIPLRIVRKRPENAWGAAGPRLAASRSETCSSATPQAEGNVRAHRAPRNRR